MDRKQQDITKNSIEIFSKITDDIVPAPNPSLVMPTPLSQEESNPNTNIRLSQESLPSSSREAHKGRDSPLVSTQSSGKRGSFKKHLINNAAQRLKEVNSSCQSLSSTDNRISDEQKPTLAESSHKNKNSQRKEVSARSASNIAISNSKSSKKTIKPQSTITPPKYNNLGDFEALDLEEATKEALRSLTSKLETPLETLESGFNESPSSRFSEKGSHVKQLNFYKQDQFNGSSPQDENVRSETKDGKFFDDFETSGSKSSEVFMNIYTLAAMNERKGLLNKNMQMSNGKISTTEFKISEEDTEETDPLGSDKDIPNAKVSTPVPNLRKKNGRDKSHSVGKVSNKQIKHKGEINSLNALKETENNKNKDIENNKYFSLAKSHESSPERLENNHIYRPKFINDSLSQNLQTKSSVENGENLVSEENCKSNRSYQESSQHMSFENPFSEKYDVARSLTSKCGLTDRLFTDPCSLHKGDSTKRERISEYILEIAESSRISETNGYRTLGYENEEEDAISQESERLTSKKCQAQLVESIKKINIRTFLALKNIIKPNDNILICCQAFVKIFAGLHEAIPSSFSIMSYIEWGNIKVLFNSPAKILNLISTLPKLIENGRVPQRNITAALVSLTKVPYQPGDPINEAFYQIYEFIVSAIEYYKYYRPEYSGSWQNNTQESHEEMNSLRSSQSINQENSLLAKVNESYQHKSPTRQENKNVFQKTMSTTASSNRRALQSTSSPMKENRASILSSSRSPQRDLHKKPFLSEAKPKTLSFSVGVKSAQKSKSPAKKSVKKQTENILQDYNFTEGAEEDPEPESIGQRVHTLEVDNKAMTLQDEIEIKEKQARDFRGKVNRLLADHERYVKRQLKAQEDDRTAFERKDELQEKKRLEEYLEFRESVEEEYLKELAMEELTAKKEIKLKEARLQRVQMNDEFMETIKEHCFIETQSERKKNEKKKQLWDQYKKKMADKHAKRQKEAEESSTQKQELVSKRIENFSWKKKQATQERDMWKESYMLLSKLVGDAK